jgi:glucosamine--fructose-6-phosphate aminotransferase (isomerizing)
LSSMVFMKPSGEESPMCGIIGYAGPRAAAPLLISGLRRLEYRGYDSAGIALLTEKGIFVKKVVGRVDHLSREVPAGLESRAGIAHTRWATHGEVAEVNAHPHTSCAGDIAVVHNGIIENYAALRRRLEGAGHRFISATDTEVIPHLIEEFAGQGLGPRVAVLRAVRRLRGSFAFACLFQGEGLIVGARMGPPLVVGVGRNGERFLASDPLSCLDSTDHFIFLDNGEVAVIFSGGHEIYTFSGRRVEKMPTQVAWELSDIDRKEFAHYTLKEIYEQPQAIEATLNQEGEALEEVASALEGAEHIVLTAAGTSYHAALAAKHLFATVCRRRVETLLASELVAYTPLLDEDTVLMAISQSGETADVLEAVRLARERGARTIGVVNVPGSTLAREVDHRLYTKAGPEVGVAATKSFTSQLTLLTLLTARMGGDRALARQLGRIPGLAAHVLDSTAEVVKGVAKRIHGVSDVFFVGRGRHYPIALEGALKMKELSYIHAEGLAGGELKHGTLALITRGTPVVALNPTDETYRDTQSNIEEMKARGGFIIGLSNRPSQAYDIFVKLPDAIPPAYPIIEVIPLQLLAYYTTVERRLDPDFPRNLAKSVTVK